MNHSIQPPVRLQPISSSDLSTRHAKRRLDAFLADFQNRSTPSKGGDNTVIAQIQKVSEALHEQMARRKVSEDMVSIVLGYWLDRPELILFQG